MKKIISFCILVSFLFVNAQTQLVFVFFKDKPNKALFYSNPTSELTQKSLDRRNKLGIAINDQDAPLEPTYIQNIINLGFTVTDYSKWLNGVAVNATTAQITLLQSQSYVQNVQSFVKTTHGKMSQLTNKFSIENPNTKKQQINFNYGNSTAQIDQVNLRPLHVAGYTGTGVTIAVLDTGFPTVDTGSAYARMRNNGQIKGGYNFVNKSSDIYNTSLNPHGANCLGIIGGYIDGTFVGSAPDANFYLYASENAAVEIPEEELYWIEAAEEADRKGVDVISTSLGYSVFDDSRYNYTYADMNGKISFIARGAQVACEKGIVVVVAAGNEGLIPWHYIMTPADNSQVFTIGAVDSSNNSSTFSSYGPNAAGAIKPDASARGTGTYFVYNNASYFGSGTSYATPLAAGGIACLLQAMSITNRDTIKDLLRQKASLYPSNSAQMGFGILNFGDALNQYLSNSDILKIYPNPISSYFYIQTNEKIISIELYDSLGRLFQNMKTENINNIEGLSKGIYYLKIKTDKKTYIEKIIKK